MGVGAGAIASFLFSLDDEKGRVHVAYVIAVCNVVEV